MTYYFDRMRHLVCVPYSVENLHKMAADLGIARSWYHGGRNPHYDVPKGRMATMHLNAVKLSPKEILKIIKKGS